MQKYQYQLSAMKNISIGLKKTFSIELYPCA